MKLALLKIARIAAKCEDRTDEIDEIQSIAEEAVWDADNASESPTATTIDCAQDECDGTYAQVPR